MCIIIEKPIPSQNLEVMIRPFSVSHSQQTLMQVFASQHTPFSCARYLGKRVVKDSTQSELEGVVSHCIDHFF